MRLTLPALLLLLALLTAASVRKPKNPNVVLFIIDDVGWADVGYRNGSGIYTPYIDSLAASGITLDNYYVQPVCSPSRAAIMQGLFPHHTGLQQFCTIMPASTCSMPRDQPTLAELFSQAGYYTGLVGKWHIGYSKWSDTPTYRGFDFHRGYLQGEIDYYNKTFTIPPNILPEIEVTGLDWWDGTQPIRNTTGIYSKYLYDEAFLELLEEKRDPTKPFFLYYAHQCAHVPLEVPEEFLANCTQSDPLRRTYCGMMAALDDSLRIVIEGLQAAGLWDETLLILTTDNGAMPYAPSTMPYSAGSNWPLRGGKGTVFEGGVRGIGIVNGGDSVIPSQARGTVNTQLLHEVDWLPTVIGLTDAQPPKNLDGFDLWDVLMNEQPVNRTGLPLNINYAVEYPDSGLQVGILWQGWKLILQNVTGPVLNYDGWFPPEGPMVPAEANPSGRFLFDLETDPNEFTNLYQARPDMVAQLHLVLEEYMLSYVEPQDNRVHLVGLPWFWDGLWSPFDPF